ncbi:MAG: hypothetical protein GY711_33670 [bacterium]|nr:hypothetical protein [bacterium]
MRSDMERVLIQRPRTRIDNVGYPRQLAAHADPETLPEREGMRRRILECITPLGPLRRFLCRRCGRPWNQVYSEVCASCDRRTLRGWHLPRHVEDEVGLRRRPGCYREFYVDDQGVLRES